VGPRAQKLLPAAKEGGEPLPEGLLWLLLTGEARARPRRAPAAVCAGRHALGAVTLGTPVPWAEPWGGRRRCRPRTRWRA